MGTLLLLYIRRLGPFLGVQILICSLETGVRKMIIIFFFFFFFFLGGGVMICILGNYFLTF